MSEETAEAEPSGIGRRRAAAQGENRTAYRERRQEIITVAADLFKARGFRGTSIGQIAEALDTDRATLYYYIGSKEELFDEVVTDAVRANVDVALAIKDGEGSAPDKLRRLVISLMESYAAHYPFLYVYIQENLGHVGGTRADWSREMRQLNKAYEDAVVAIIQSGIDEGTIRPIAEAWVMAYGLIGMFGWTNRWFNPATSPVDAATIGAAYADILLRGMTADPA
jgi:TetR/AcrR family transcriptional regulator, cholesterol catabolism regulator